MISDQDSVQLFDMNGSSNLDLPFRRYAVYNSFSYLFYHKYLIAVPVLWKLRPLTLLLLHPLTVVGVGSGRVQVYHKLEAMGRRSLSKIKPCLWIERFCCPRDESCE